jgi:hypothetical protein
MINGQCPTWFVVKWISSHHSHYAETPKVPYEYRRAYYSDNGSGAVIRGACEPRNDWTIFRGDGKPVKFKRKNPLKRVGEMRPWEILRVSSENLFGRQLLPAAEKSFDVFVRERKS